MICEFSTHLIERSPWGTSVCSFIFQGNAVVSRQLRELFKSSFYVFAQGNRQCICKWYKFPKFSCFSQDKSGICALPSVLPAVAPTPVKTNATIKLATR